MEDVARRIESRKAVIDGEATYSNAREMSRREMEIEQALYRGTEKAQNLNHLIKERSQGL